MGSRPPGGIPAGPNQAPTGGAAGSEDDGAPGDDVPGWQPGFDHGSGFDFDPGDDGIDVVLEEAAWRSAVPRVEAVARRAAAAAFAEAGVEGAVTVLLTGDFQVKRLNGDHRGKVKPTNVLSFPPLHPGMPGDVAVALGTVRREARAAGRSVMAHLSHLVAHGVLHLTGHDHLRAGEARRMERAEARIMRRLALPNPWRGVA